MKHKMTLLILAFCTVGLLSSSKECANRCGGKCINENMTAETAGEKKSEGGADLARPLTPSNFLFLY